MNIIRRLLDAGIAQRNHPVDNKHIRFTNAVALFVCLFILQNAAFAIYYHQPHLILVYVLHFFCIALVLLFNYKGKRVLASAWFSGAAIIFVTFYAICFTLESFNFVFLSMIIFLQFFLFSAAEKKMIITFAIISTVSFATAILWPEIYTQPLLSLPKGLLTAQRWNSIIGIPLLSIVFGVYAFSTIHKAEQEVEREKEKSDLLLLNILPATIAERFKNDQSFMAESYSSVSVLFADIVGFTGFSEKIPPGTLVMFLNKVFSKFDELTETLGLEKIKTIGDAYMVAGGVPVPADDHVSRVCLMALQIQEWVREMKTPAGEMLKMRVGISVGPITAGVIGVKKFIYDLWGDTVNTASRMESYAEGDTIHITEEVYQLIKDQFICKKRGTIEVKGKGFMTTYFLLGVKKAE